MHENGYIILRNKKPILKVRLSLRPLRYVLKEESFLNY